MKTIRNTAITLSLALLLAGCSNMTPKQQRMLSGAAIGAGAGAGISAISGGSVGTGAAIGAGVGAVGGALMPDR